VRALIEFAVGGTRPALTLLLMVPLAESEARRQSRQIEIASPRDRLEEAGRAFFERVETGYRAIAAAEPHRVRVLDSTQPIETVQALIWRLVEPFLAAQALAAPSRR
jgi:dTMP kinase